ncbi:hypothetical protein Ancab_005344 [Ancistrocladus abbreviatus]
MRKRGRRSAHNLLSWKLLHLSSKFLPLMQRRREFSFDFCFSPNQSTSKVGIEGDGCPAPPTANKSSGGKSQISSNEQHDDDAKKSKRSSSSSRPSIPFTYFPVGSRLSVL